MWGLDGLDGVQGFRMYGDGACIKGAVIDCWLRASWLRSLSLLGLGFMCSIMRIIALSP